MSGWGRPAERPITSVRLVDPAQAAERLLRRAGHDLGPQVEQHQQVAQVAGEERHLVGAGDQHLLGRDDRVDRGLDVGARELVRGVLDVDVVGGQRGLELGVVEREQRRRGRRACRRPPSARPRAGDTRRGRPAGARGSPRSRAPARSARRCSRRCWPGGPAPRRSGRRPRRGGRRCTGRRPSASARTRRSARGCSRTGPGGRAAPRGVAVGVDACFIGRRLFRRLPRTFLQADRFGARSERRDRRAATYVRWRGCWTPRALLVLLALGEHLGHDVDDQHVDDDPDPEERDRAARASARRVGELRDRAFRWQRQHAPDHTRRAGGRAATPVR